MKVREKKLGISDAKARNDGDFRPRLTKSGCSAPKETRSTGSLHPLKVKDVLPPEKERPPPFSKGGWKWNYQNRETNFVGGRLGTGIEGVLKKRPVGQNSARSQIGREWAAISQ